MYIYIFICNYVCIGALGFHSRRLRVWEHPLYAARELLQPIQRRLAVHAAVQVVVVSFTV